MTFIVEGSTVTQAFGKFLGELPFMEVLSEDTRNGRVYSVPHPIVIKFSDPTKRVLFSPKRDANPFFHLFEALWMLGGRNDVDFVSKFNSNIKNYSDDQSTFHGAYGYRWRRHFFIDQLDSVVRQLSKDPSSRRVVLTMWDPYVDFETDGKDLPCNTHIYFRVIDGNLDITVCNRSNDVIWGMFGANAVHMSVLQEYVALRLGVGVGVYYQISNNAHIYVEALAKYGGSTGGLATELKAGDDYGLNNCIVCPLFNQDGCSTFHENLEIFLNDPYATDWVADGAIFDRVVWPMVKAWFCRKINPELSKKVLRSAIQCYGNIDWLMTSLEWLERRNNVINN